MHRRNTVVCKANARNNSNMFGIVVTTLLMSGLIQTGLSTTEEEWKVAVYDLLDLAVFDFDAGRFADASTIYAEDAHNLSPGDPTQIGIDAIADWLYSPGTRKFFPEKYEVVDFLYCADWALVEATFTDHKTKSTGKYIGVYKMVDGSAQTSKYIWNWD